METICPKCLGCKITQEYKLETMQYETEKCTFCNGKGIITQEIHKK